MIAIVRYSAGNIGSVSNALQRLGAPHVVTDDADVLRSADKVIFPGVGEASSAMADLRRSGLDALIPQLTQPVLGICLGLQLLCEHTEEGDTAALGVLPIRVKRFRRERIVPHMGWNSISALSSPLFKGIAEHSDVFFVHSFHAELSPFTAAVCTYGEPFSAAIHYKNFHAVQFHPEKSSAAGETLLQNFLSL